MHYLRKSIRDALKTCLKYQADSANYYRTARMAYNAVRDGLGDKEAWLADAAAWQSVAASTADWGRQAFDRWQRFTYEYETAKASLVKVDGEYHQRIDGGTRRLYTTKEGNAISRAWADIFRDRADG